MKEQYKKVFELIHFKNFEEFEEIVINFENAIENSLINHFEKEEETAKKLVKKFNLWEVVKENPLILHDSPEKVALMILTDEGDLEAIEKYYGM